MVLTVRLCWPPVNVAGVAGTHCVVPYPVTSASGEAVALLLHFPARDDHPLPREALRVLLLTVSLRNVTWNEMLASAPVSVSLNRVTMLYLPVSS